MSLFSVIVLSCLVAVTIVVASEATVTLDTSTAALLERVGPPSQDVIKEFEGAGMIGVSDHPLSGAERVKVGEALAALPEIHRKMLLEHLDRLSFVDGIPGEGTGLTAPSPHDGSYTITFRASIITETLSEYLTTKERRLFTSEEGGPRVTLTAEGLDALPFAVLHESTHVVDNILGIKRNPDHPLIAEIWQDTHQLKQPYAHSLAATTAFRGGPKIPAEQAQGVYEALADSPFVSLYSTAAASEDIAELVAWYEEFERRNAALLISISAADGHTIYRSEPLKAPLVADRFRIVKSWLDEARNGLFARN